MRQYLHIFLKQLGIKKGKVVFLNIICFFIFFGCTPGSDTIELPENYTGWKTTTNTELNYPIPGHESHYRKIYINPTGTNVKRINNNGTIRHKYPQGSIIIKESYPTLDYNEGDTPESLTAMVKAPGHPKNQGGWVWIVKAPADSGEEKIIESEFCITCHSNANEPHPYGEGNPNGEFRDFVFFPFEEE